MFESIIKFKTNNVIIEDKSLYPIPTKLNIPDWFKELKYSIDNKTIKGCIPFLETLTSGYILKMPIDYHIVHNKIVENERITRFETSPTNLPPSVAVKTNINYQGKNDFHSTNQLGNKCPFNQKNKNLPFHKVLNPWVIETPPGYSCLFLQPLNNADDRFSIIPGIVDTDTFENEINFPFIVNGDKYPILESTIKVGTPYVQVIPFKRDNWKMKVEKIDDKLYVKRKFKLGKNIIHNYKQLFWNKRSWK